MTLPATGPATGPAAGERAAELRRRHAEALQMGGPQAVDRHRASGRLPVRERIALLLDEGSWFETGVLAQPERRTGGGPPAVAPWDTHACLGAQLARIEARVALPKILGRLGDIRVLGGVAWRPNIASRAVTGLRVGHG